MALKVASTMYPKIIISIILLINSFEGLQKLRRYLEHMQMARVLLLFNLDVAEEKSKSRTAWAEETFSKNSEELLEDTTVDLQHAEERTEDPDVCESDLGKEASPAECIPDGTQEGEDHVQEVFSSLEAFVSTFPNTVSTMCSFWLCEYIFKLDLKLKVNINDKGLMYMHEKSVIPSLYPVIKTTTGAL